MRPTIGPVLLLALLLSACGAADPTQSDTALATSSTAAASAASARAASAAATAPTSDAPKLPVSQSPAGAAPAADESSAAGDADTGTSFVRDSDLALGVAAAAANAVMLAYPSAAAADDGCPAPYPEAHGDRSSLAATWNGDGTITVRGGLDVPADAVVHLQAFQHGREVGWNDFGEFGIVAATPQVDHTSFIPPADDILYSEFVRLNPYEADAPVCVMLMAIRGDVSVRDIMGDTGETPTIDPADLDAWLLTLVRLPVAGAAPAEIALR